MLKVVEYTYSVVLGGEILSLGGYRSMTGMQIQNFKVFKEKTFDEREELIQKILHIWKNNSRDYRENLKKYNELLDNAKALGLKIKKLNKSELQSYPKVYVLSLESEEEVRAHLLKISEKDNAELRGVLWKCENVCINYAFNSIKTILFEARYQMNQKKEKEEKEARAKNSDYMQTHNLWSF